MKIYNLKGGPVFGGLTLSSQGRNLPEICREIGVTTNTYYRWRKEYGGMQVNQAKRLKELERENSRLKRAVADLTLDNLILKEASEICERRFEYGLNTTTILNIAP